MSIDTSAELAVELLPEVVEFATQQGVEEYLPKILEMTRRIFSGVDVKVVVENDWEIPDERYIVFEVAVAWMCRAR